MSLKRITLGLAASVAAGAFAVSSASAASAEPLAQSPGAGDGAPSSVSATTVTKYVWHDAPSYVDRGYVASTGDYLYAGNNYFYCQEKGATMGHNQYHNNWWLKTDDDEDNTNVWVNAVFVSGGGNYEPIPGVPYC